MFTYGSICSGIEAVTCAWHDFAKPLWFSEIEPFPCAVLAHHYPTIPNLGDMTALPDKILNREIPAPDILVGGTPCQAFSYAGRRQSLDDVRGNLTLTFIEIANAIDYIRHQNGKQPAIILWENVPGVLSTKDNAFGHFLAGLANGAEPLRPFGQRWSNAGYVHSKRTVTWRTLNAQYFGLAQRRKRVFVVASARERSTCQILFEQAGVPRNTAPIGEASKNATAFIETGFAQYRQSEVGGTVTASGGALSGGSETIVVHGTQDPITSKESVHCIGRNNWQENVLFEVNKTIIRKLTPRECERLMGFPDDYTKIPYRNKPAEQCQDSPRYKAIGNSMAVNVMRWIGLRINDYIKDYGDNCD